jgi:CheY-like chemotaxis protein
MPEIYRRGGDYYEIFLGDHGIDSSRKVLQSVLEAKRMNPHILIVEDATDQLTLMKLVFKMVDPQLEIATVQSGEEALVLVHSDPNSRPKVMLIDLKMPGKNGIEVLKEMKSDPQLRRIPICLFSNADTQEDICDCYEHGASFYFRKPIGLKELQAFATRFRDIWFTDASLCLR